ncbi:MAG: hypothetical protein ACK4QW_06615 [Alphaproteobacteria bacterium]
MADFDNTRNVRRRLYVVGETVLASSASVTRRDALSTMQDDLRRILASLDRIEAALGIEDARS